MERSDSILLCSVSNVPRHQYTTISDEPETMNLNQESWPSRDRKDTHTESSETQESDAPAEGPTKGSLEVASTALHRSGYILFLTLIYITLAAFSWVVICYLSFRPITAAHYGARFSGTQTGYGRLGDANLTSLYEKNQRWYHAARVIQSIVGVMAIPLTSAVCSSAAVIFIQQRHSRGGLTMRQVMTIADKGWTDIPTYFRTFPFFGTKRWKRYGSSFLLLSCFTILLGLVIPPLQEIFLSTNTIKTPTSPSEVPYLLDIPDQLEYLGGDESYRASNLIVILTRNALASTTNVQRQPQIWQGPNGSCALPEKWGSQLPPSCNRGGVTLGNMSALESPFLAQLPSGYSTGLIQQFLPRINSTAQYRKIAADEFPEACDQIDGSFYVKYFNETDRQHGSPTAWGIEACMPANLRNTPWKSTRDRQDFTEELYLNITLVDYEYIGSPSVNNLFYKVTLDTTAGYFELPNYMNGQIAGPLLDKDPNHICGSSCETEGFRISNHAREPKAKRANQTIFIDGSWPLEAVPNKGPLLTIALALFGEGSFIPARQAYRQAYTIDFNTVNPHVDYVDYAGICENLAPMGFLLADDIGQTTSNNDEFCITHTVGGDPISLDIVIASWISNFNYDEERLTNAFSAAAFLANQAWMENNVPLLGRSLSISFDMGHDTHIPVISQAGLICVSLLLGLYILILLAFALYSASTPRWTSTLNSFAMMRIGAAIADKVPLLVGQKTDRIDVLDKIPGSVGDQSDESDVMGKIGLGAPKPLSATKNRRFESYPGDREPLDRLPILKIHGKRNTQV